MPEEPLIEIHEIKDDLQLVISDAVSPDLRRAIKRLTPTEFRRGQGRARFANSNAA